MVRATSIELRANVGGHALSLPVSHESRTPFPTARSLPEVRDKSGPIRESSAVGRREIGRTSCDPPYDIPYLNRYAYCSRGLPGVFVRISVYTWYAIKKKKKIKLGLVGVDQFSTGFSR